MGLKTFIKKIPGVNPAICFAKEQRQELRTAKAFREERKIPRTGPIRVGFLCQYIPAWAKVAPIYAQMQTDPRFSPYLLCLPSGIKNNSLIDPSNDTNDTYEYMVKNGYPEAINVLTGKEQWLDLKPLELAYLFYPRPYNPLLPLCYTPEVVSSYCRVCILMYGMTTTQDTCSITLNKDFMRHVYYYFAETPFAQRENIRRNRRLHRKGLQHTLCIGYPVLEQLAQQKDQPQPAWDFSKNAFRILWTPRWSTAKEVGGSNFFTYQDFFLTYAQEHPDVDILIRPHPLMFTNFLQTGEMTQNQVDAFISQCEQLPNVSLDTRQEYEATLWGCSVLVSDLSGIMPEFFTTGKPMIFCSTNMELKLADYFEEMVNEGCYVAADPSQLPDYLEALKHGQDLLCQARQDLIIKLFGSAGKNATVHIVEQLATDAAL